MSLPGLQRLVSASESDIIEIINTINYNLQSIPNYIKVCVEQFGYFDMQPDKIDADVCTDCGACADVCPVEAIHPA